MKFLFQLVTVLVLFALFTYATLSWLGRTSNSEMVAELSPAEQAAQLAETRGCLACHTLDGSKGIGPSWWGSWGTLRELQDGSSVLVDEAYLRLAMQNPAAQIAAGYDPIMLPSGFTEAEMSLIINLIRDISLGGAE